VKISLYVYDDDQYTYAHFSKSKLYPKIDNYADFIVAFCDYPCLSLCNVERFKKIYPTAELYED